MCALICQLGLFFIIISEGVDLCSHSPGGVRILVAIVHELLLFRNLGLYIPAYFSALSLSSQLYGSNCGGDAYRCDLSRSGTEECVLQRS